MDEDPSAKVPVTRARRRLSVESEEANSPAPSTPTKKRGVRLAAKPQLELISEVVTENVPKRTTRKAAAKEGVAPEEAAVTPSRRSTRIRSNTSVLSETTLTVESPRAKRALRRNSVLGSDTESAVTPARQTRRTRRGSTSSVDKPAGSDNLVASTVTLTNAEPITEETENTNKNLKANETGDNDLHPTRKSPRLQNKKTDVEPKNNKHVEKPMEKTVTNSTTPVKSQQASQVTIHNMEIEEKINNTSTKLDEKLGNHTTVNIVRINSVQTTIEAVNPLNKSTPSIEKISNDFKNKRTRTKSWTTLTTPPTAGFNSDNESSKEITKLGTTDKGISGSGDGLLTNDENRNVIEAELKSPNRSTNSKTLLNISSENKENLVLNAITKFEMNKNDTVELFQNSPNVMQPLVVIDDSDSGSVGKASTDIQMDGEAVMNPATHESPKETAQTYEPMDIDESIPRNVTIDDFSEKSNSSKEEIDVPKERKSLICQENNISADKALNKSVRKSISLQPDKLKRESKGDKQDNKNKSTSSFNNSNSYSEINSSLQGKSTATIEKPDGFSKNESISALKKSNKNLNSSIQDNSNDAINKSNRSSLLSVQVANDSECEFKKKSETSSRKSSISIGDQSVKKLEESLNKSKRKSSTSQNNSGNMKPVEDENKDCKFTKKSKRSTSMSQSDSQNFEKTANENKSTLVISQLKDVSTNDNNHAMSPNVTNNEMSKSINERPKEIDKKNVSLHYLTSTPIQQKPLQKLTMQINTSIISPNVESKKHEKENTPKKTLSKVESDSDSSDESEKEIKVTKQSGATPNKNSSVSVSSDLEDKFNEKKLVGYATKKMEKQSPNKKEPSDSSDSSEDESKTPHKKSVNESKSKLTRQTWLSSDSSDDSEEETAKNKSKIIDDEAFDAGEDYESGDSQDDEDKKHEEENRIVEKGETLDSEEDFSNDSDYEKDSFIVSSDAEDDEMLSGTGDDLSLSDSELTMGAKSKKKFNERKQKQQKKASREMYEARHNIDESDNVSRYDELKSENSKRQSLESSALESENEKKKPKKKNRLRIDSSQDIISADQSEADESIKIKKKKSKRLSESVCEDMTTNEKEITVYSQRINEKNDPLAVAIKLEPKTPLKNFDISTVAITERIEEVEVDTNTSMVKQNDTLDPLQESMAAGEDSSSSDNEEIIQNYDSVLNSLNMQSKKIKSFDTSLNLNKKSKSKNAKNPVIDELNLTEIREKKSKKNKNKSGEDSKPTTPAKSEGIDKVNSKEDGDVSDSIDMKLLFPEDSNDSEIHASQFKPEISIATEEFIPLKRTEAKTNIPGNIDFSVSLNDSVGKKKNKKRKSSQCIPDEVPSKPDEDSADCDIKIIMDTTGTHEAMDETLTQSSSAKKKKKKNKIKSVTIEESTKDMITTMEADCIDNIAEMPANITIKSNKKKNKSDVSVNNVSMDDDPIVATQTLSAKKRPKKISMSAEDVEPLSQNTGEESDDAPLEVAYRSEKKGDEVVSETAAGDAEARSCEKKHKKKNKKKKKNKDLSQSFEKSDDIKNTPSSEQDVGDSKKQKSTTSRNALNGTEGVANALLLESTKTSDEKKKLKIHLDDECIELYNDTNEPIASGSNPKKSKKKRKSKNLHNVEQDEVPQQNPKKRKYREDDNEELVAKVPKEHSFDSVNIPRLPESILNQLADKPNKAIPAVLSTAPFVVEDVKRRKNKPSNYLEQSVNLNEDHSMTMTPEKKKRKRSKYKPKVLPFVPTVLTSDSGYTSKFNINVIPKETPFIAQASNTVNFKQAYLDRQRIKKFKTFEHCKSQRCHKLSKF